MPRETQAYQLVLDAVIDSSLKDSPLSSETGASTHTTVMRLILFRLGLPAEFEITCVTPSSSTEKRMRVRGMSVG